MSAGFVPLNPMQINQIWKYAVLQYTKETDIFKNQPTVKKAHYNWILKHPQIVVSTIANYCLELSIYGQVEPQLVPKLLFHVSVIELHNIIVSPPEEGGLK